MLKQVHFHHLNNLDSVIEIGNNIFFQNVQGLISNTVTEIGKEVFTNE